jgi:hypothetical protein
MKAYHTFLLLREGEGCRIVTEGVVKGPGAKDFWEKQPAALSTLKQRSEQ